MTAYRVVTLLIVSALTNYAYGDTFGSGANSFTIDFVTIGDPGNAADTTGSPNPAGSVSYAYRIGTYEISEQMIDKANTLGGLAIIKDTRGADKPATNITWNEAARFVNWLNASTGSPLAYKFALQPGDHNYDAKNNDIQVWTPSDAGYNSNNLYRNSLARYFLPSVNEWYKAAYYDPTNGVYYDYPTGSNTAPTDVASGTAADTAVYSQQLGQGPADIMLAGGLSPYGTMGQGGNVLELQETDNDLVNGPTGSDIRVIRGGTWNLSFDYMSSSLKLVTSTDTSGILYGFRVASAAVPEPSTAVLAASILALLAIRRSR